jgi:uncharacterized RDD family membrane protein YckC
MVAPNRPGAPTAERERKGSPYPKCALWLRLGARASDLAIAWAIFVVGERVGPVLALLYLLLGDGVLQGQSLGKRLFGVKVVYLPTRAAGRKRDSTLRNAPIAFPIVLGMMPEPLGLYAFFAGALLVGLVEGFQVWRDPLGLRLGDHWAQTQVVDGKVPIDAGVLARSERAGAPGQPGRALYLISLRRVAGRARRRRRCG